MKKILKKFLVFALLIVQFMPINVANAGTNNNTGTITINSTSEGKDYSIYEILKLESYDNDKEAYSYTIVSGWEDFINNGAGKNYLVVDSEGYVTWKDGVEKTDAVVKEFAKLAKSYAEENNISATQTITATKDSVTFNNLNLGYYLVDSSLGALCGLTTTKPSANLYEKNSIPGIEKEVKEDSSGTFGSNNDATIGDIVEFKTTITVGLGAQNYKLHDKMSKGLSLIEDSFKITALNEDGTEVVTTDKYTILENAEGNDTFTISFNNALVEEIGVNGTITVLYNAILNEQSVIAGNGNINETNLDYGNNHNIEAIPTVTYTYEFDVVKTTSSNELLVGAEFELLGNDNKTIIDVVFVETIDNVNVYRVAKDGETGVKIAAGVARIQGLDSDTYYLNETKIPDGFNRLAENPQITINKANNDAIVENNTYLRGGLQVINYTGAELPSTGGIGTQMFITIGSILVLGFGVLLVTKLRMTKIAE